MSAGAVVNGVCVGANGMGANLPPMEEMQLAGSSAYLEPGVYFDQARRIFRLRCKNSMYAFRVDDSKNLEHLYWGPPLPPGDDIMYLTKAHVRAPFDPVGEVSVAKILGLEELQEINDEKTITEKWRVFTKQKDGEVGDARLRSRRLENALWRLWNMERHRGGDPNALDLSENALSSALMIEHEEGTSGEDGVSQPEADLPPRGAESAQRKVRTNGASDGTHIPAGVSSRSVDASPLSRAPVDPRLDAELANDAAELPRIPVRPIQKQRIAQRPGPGGMMSSHSAESVQKLERNALARDALAREAGDIGIAAKEELRRAAAAPQSPRLRSRRPSSAALSSMGMHGMQGSVSDFAVAQQDGAWRNLDEETVGKNTKLLEFSDLGTGDYREPSFRLSFSEDGSSICPLVYRKHRILSRKPPLPGYLPGVHAEQGDATTLIVEMHDPVKNVIVNLYYTVMHELDIITRRTEIINEGYDSIKLYHLAAATVDFDAEFKFYMTQLSGGWARERQIVTRQLEDGVTVVKSCRGASSHQANPFVAITPRSEPSEDDGECFGFCFVYSGNFLITADVSEYGRLRVNVGINPEGFSWFLDKDEDSNIFSTPELIMSYSSEGLGQMSREMHRLIRDHVVPKHWRYKVPPVLLNTWEAVYFDVKHEVIVEIGRVAAEAHVELLVLDDGWFGERHNTMSGLGDWTANRQKLPYGLEGLAKDINKFGLKFGIWIEPEMVSMESELYQAHPDWCLNFPGRSRTTGRNQLVLDFSRQVVRDHIFEQLRELLSSANIDYIKWDMNRHLTEVFSQDWHAERQGEIAHRFILGVYEVMFRLTKAFPHVLLETCSGGGGRFDAGMLYFSSQIWTSDNTDALSRVRVQYGTSLAYPASTMGAHVSAIPNHQTLRTTSMKTRSLVAMSGTFGYELDPRQWTDDDIEEIQGYIRLQKRIAPLVYEGDMYRLWSPFQSDSAAWMFVARDKMRAIVIAVNTKREVCRLDPRLRLRGLINEMTYCVEELCPGTIMRNVENGAMENDPRGVYQFGRPMNITGHTLTHAGLPVKFMFDGDSVVFELNAVCKVVSPTSAAIRYPPVAY